MIITIEQIIVWIIIGLIGGTLAGAVIRRDRRGFGWWRNLVVGLIGALIGGLLFRLLDILPGLDRIAVSMRDIAAAFIGALVFLLILALWRKT